MTPTPTANGLYDEGVAHLKRGEYEQAVDALSKAIRLNPDLTNAYVGRALAYRSLGNDAAAAADDRAVQRRGGVKLLHEGLLILTPPLFPVGERIDPGEFAAFVEAVEVEIQRYFRESRVTQGVDINAACALLPSGRLLVDVQTCPAWPLVRTAGLAERIERLNRPGVRGGPVAFVRSTTVNGGCLKPHAGFATPFASILTTGRRQTLDELLMAVDRGRWASWWAGLRRFFGGRP